MRFLIHFQATIPLTKGEVGLMIIVVAALKGGVGKTTTSIHLAQYFATRKPKRSVVLLDGDPNRTVIDWAESSTGKLPFQVASDVDKLPSHDILIVDTAARTSDEDLSDLLKSSSLTIIPTKPDAFDVRTTIAFAEIMRGDPNKYRILLTGLPARGRKLADEARQMFTDSGLMVFDGGIRNYAVYREATYSGVPVSMMGKPGKLAFTDYEAVGKQIVKGWM
jgi:chromosome partitioning protein